MLNEMKGRQCVQFGCTADDICVFVPTQVIPLQGLVGEKLEKSRTANSQNFIVIFVSEFQHTTEIKIFLTKRQ